MKYEQDLTWKSILIFHCKLIADESYFDTIVLWCPFHDLLSNLLYQAKINLEIVNRYSQKKREWPELRFGDVKLPQNQR